VRPDKSLRLVVSGGGKVVLGTADASRGVARLDDTTTGGTLSMTVLTNTPPGFNTGTLLYTGPNGVPQSIGEFVIPGAITAGSATLAGKINTASDTVVSA
jgi:hypothetical protein